MSLEAPTITLDGYILNDYYSIRGISRPWPQVTPDTMDVVGRAGTVLRGIALGTRTVSFRIGAHDPDHQSLMNRFQWLIELLALSETHELAFSDEGGAVRIVTLDATPSYEEYVDGASVELSFTMCDPYRIDTMESMLVVPSGGSASFRCFHPRPSIVISASNVVRDSSTHLWGLRFDGGDFLRVKLASDDAVLVGIDCPNRHVTVNSQTSMVTLTSDWPQLGAGSHTVSMDVGTGTATLTIRERYL